MKKYLFITVSILAVIFTIWYMHFGSLTENSGALSVTGLDHPVYFTIWGVLTFTGIYANLLLAYKKLLPKVHFQYIFFGLSAIGMLLTLSCDFDYSIYIQYVLHCFGSLLFSVSTATCVFLLFFLNAKRNKVFTYFTWIIGTILIADLILLLIFKESALIEAVPVLFALIVLPILNFSTLFKDKEYASR
ncbi:MAG: hypothetical protein K2F65_06480 [Eubacterium sp.]|nr:hypothetical protein [Eubacterium sp.]